MKYHQVARVLEQRITRGDYVLSHVPGERDIATEQGVSHMTARRAVQTLVEKKVLVRKPNGRIDVNKGLADTDFPPSLQVAFMAPAFDSYQVSRWRSAVATVLDSRRVMTRPLTYVHWGDPVVSEALNSFDGVFLVPSTEAMPEFIQNQLRTCSSRVVSLEMDLTALGVPSVCPFPAIAIQRLLQHLWQMGHRKIDFLNTQSTDTVSAERIGQWQLWSRLSGAEGVLHNEPVRAFESALPRAYEVIRDLLASGGLDATAILCSTEPAAIGCVRALRESGRVVGKEVSVCVVNDEGLGRYLSPTMTALEMADPQPYLSLCAQWMTDRSQKWSGPLLLQPSEVPLFIGESTGPPPNKVFGP